MAIFHVPTSDAVEPEVVSEGKYNLRIRTADPKEASTGRPMLLLMVENLDVPNAETIFHNITGVMDADEPDKRNKILLMTKRFLTRIGYPGDQDNIDTAQLLGLQFRGVVGVEMDNHGLPRNVIKTVL